MSLETIAVERLHPHPENPMRMEGIEELARSIETTGLLHPLHVVPDPNTKGEYQVIAGCRRLAALQMLDPKDAVECVVHTADVDIEMVRFAENEQRINVHPLDQSEHVAAMLFEYKHATQVANLLGISVYRVNQLAQVQQLPDEVKKLYREEHLTWPHIKLLLQVYGKDEQKELALEWAGGDWSGPIPIERCKHDLDHSLHLISSAPWKLDDDELPGGACSTCVHNTGKDDDFLFEDLADKARCTNPQCWKEKGEAWQFARMEELRAQGETVMTHKDAEKREREYKTNGWVPLSMSLGRFNDGAPTKGRTTLKTLLKKSIPWTWVPLPDYSVMPHARRLLIERALLEKGLCTNESLGYTDDYRPGDPIPKSKEYVDKDKEGLKRAKKNQIVVSELAKAAPSKVYDLDPGDEAGHLPIWRAVAAEYLAMWEHTVLSRFAKSRGLELKEGESPSRYAYEPLITELVNKAGTQAILGMMLECMIWGQWPAKYRPELRNETKKLAEILGIDLKPLHDLARAKTRPRTRKKK